MTLKTGLLVGFAALAVGGASGCGDEPADQADIPPEQTATHQPNHEIAPPSDTSDGGGARAERKLVAGAERELKGTGGWDRWAAERIEAAGPDDLVVHTGLDPETYADKAATGICTTLRHPGVTRIKVDLVQVIAGSGDEIEPPACAPQ